MLSLVCLNNSDYSTKKNDESSYHQTELDRRYTGIFEEYICLEIYRVSPQTLLV